MGAFRNDLHAAHEVIRRIEQELAISRADDADAAAKIAALEQQLVAARAAIDELERDGPRPHRVGPAVRRWLREHTRWVLWGSLIAVVAGSCVGIVLYNRAYPSCAVLSQSDRRDLYAHETLCYCNTPGAWSCFVAGGMYLRGEETEKDEARARELYERACTHGWGAACDRLADLDKPNAITWLRRGCELGDIWSCNNLGVHLQAGTGVPRDVVEARRVFAKACDYTVVHAVACRNLGFSLRDDAPVDPEGARRAFRRACENNTRRDIVGCASLGFELEATAPTEAAGLYQTACDARHAWSCHRLGQMTRDGRGVPASPALATDLFRRACAGGETTACKER